MGITSSREYMGSVTVNLTQAKQMLAVQRAAYKSGIVKLEGNALTTGISAGAAVLGLLFVTNTVVGVVAGITSLFNGLVNSAKDALEVDVNNGNNGLLDIVDFLESNTKYTSVEMKLPFLEYVVDGKTIRFCIGKGYPVRVKTASGWITM